MDVRCGPEIIAVCHAVHLWCRVVYGLEWEWDWFSRALQLAHKKRRSRDKAKRAEIKQREQM